jgi:hypothetical protein
MCILSISFPLQVFLLFFFLPKGHIFDLRRYNSAQTHTDIDSAHTDIDSAHTDIDSARIDIDSARIDDSFLIQNMDLSEAGERKGSRKQMESRVQRST